jgi:hypothetical protein
VYRFHSPGYNVVLYTEGSMKSASVAVPDCTNKTRNFIKHEVGSVEKKIVLQSHVSIKPLNSVYTSSLMIKCSPHT